MFKKLKNAIAAINPTNAITTQEVTVHVPKVKLPKIHLPKLNVPTTEVTVKVPKVSLPKVKLSKPNLQAVGEKLSERGTHLVDDAKDRIEELKVKRMLMAEERKANQHSRKLARALIEQNKAWNKAYDAQAKVDQLLGDENMEVGSKKGKA